jgi:hypothetical protein
LAGLESNRLWKIKAKQEAKGEGREFKIKMRRDAGSAGRPVYRDELTFFRTGQTDADSEWNAEPEEKRALSSFQTLFFFFPFMMLEQREYGPSMPSEP